MDTPTTDPDTDQQITNLSLKLSEIVQRNTPSAVIGKMESLRTSHKEQEQAQQLEQIIYDLLDDKNELRGIAEAYKEKFVAQRISEEEITYITDSLMPLLRELLEKTSSDENQSAASLQQGLDILAPLLSVQMLTVLQLMGFSFKQAIGEPLTLLLRQFITSKAPIDQQTNAEYSKLMMAFNVELAKIAQNEGAAEKWERWRVK